MDSRSAPHPLGIGTHTVADGAATARERRRFAAALAFRRRQRQRVQVAAHLALERRIDHLVLLHLALALEGGRDDARGVVIAVARQILYLDARVGEGLFDHGFDLGLGHGHVGSAPYGIWSASRSSRATTSSAGSLAAIVTPSVIRMMHSASSVALTATTRSGLR